MGEKGNASDGEQTVDGGGTQEKPQTADPREQSDIDRDWDKPGWKEKGHKSPQQLVDEGFPKNDVEDMVDEWIEHGDLKENEGAAFNKAWRLRKGGYYR